MSLVSTLKTLLSDLINATEPTDRSLDSLEKEKLEKRLEEVTAKSDFLQERVDVLEAELSEAEELSRQLKEALDRWKS